MLEGLRHDVELRDGEHVTLRPITPHDKDLLIQAMSHLSIETRRRRFFSPVRTLSIEQLRYFTEIDYVDHFAWIALAAAPPSTPTTALGPDTTAKNAGNHGDDGDDGARDDHRVVGVARYIRRANEHDAAEWAIVVADEYQGRGLGSILLQELGVMAAQHGVRHFVASVLSDNAPMLHLVHDLGATTHYDGSGVTLVAVELPAEPIDMRELPIFELLRRAARRDAAARDAGRMTEELDRDDCIARLAAADFGRLAVVIDGRPHIFPVNIQWVQDRVVFRSDPGLKARASQLGWVALEVDDIAPSHREGWSVVVHGWSTDVTTAVDPEFEAIRAAALPETVDGDKHLWFAITPEEITGRRVAARTNPAP